MNTPSVHPQRPTSDQWKAAHPALILNGHQYEGPCPLCGGRDRFHVDTGGPDPDRDGLFGCRQCAPEGAAPPEFYRDCLQAVGLWEDRPQESGPALYGRCEGKTCNALANDVVALYQHPDGQHRCHHQKRCPAHQGGGDCDYPKCNGRKKWHRWGSKAEARDGCFVLLWGQDHPEATLVVVEGENAALALREHVTGQPFIPLTWMGGAGKESHTDWTPVARRRVIIWRDNDKPGERSGKAVAALCRAAGASSVEQVPDAMVRALPKTGDAADVSPEQALAMLDAAHAIAEDAAAESCPNCPDWLAPDMGGLLTDHGEDAISPDADARRLLRQHGPHIMLVAAPGAGAKDCALYGLNTVGLWEGQGHLEQWLEAQAREAFDHIKAHMGPGAPFPKAALRHFARDVRNHEARARALAAMPSVRPASYGAVIVDAADTHGRYLGCKNGVVDLADARLLPAAEGRQHAVTQSTGIDYVKDAKHDYIPRLFENMEEDAAEYLIAVLGRAMWGQPDDVSVVLLGQTRAGKSTLLKALWAALGPDYYGTAPADVFDRTARFRSTHNEERRGFYGPRICAIIEGGGRAVDTQLFNASTGQDTQAYREIREKAVSRTPTATMVWCANSMPKLDMADPAVRERTRIVDYAPIPQEKRDPAIRDTFANRDADASQAVLALLVRAASENPHGRTIPLPASIQAAIDRAVDMASDDLDRFIDNALAYDRMGKLAVQDVWDRWALWCDGNGLLRDGEEYTGDVVGGLHRNHTFARTFTPAFSRRGWQIGPVKAIKLGGEVKKGWKFLRFQGQPYTAEMKLAALSDTNKVTVTGGNPSAATLIRKESPEKLAAEAYPPVTAPCSRCKMEYEGKLSAHLQECPNRAMRGAE